ncbi:MAG TPA: multiheme c-type cytochrome [Candidatus Polarisedimenticolaceae bacterium]|nr:multiheme c-type cytochrome [Candidatus Polarisedimenticolaceae bacterium]
MHLCRHTYAYRPPLLCLGILTLAVVVVAVGCQDPPAAPAPAQEAAVGTPEGRFLGSDACRACHADVFRAWEGSRHHAALTAAAAGGPIEPPADGSPAYRVGGRHREDLWVRLADGRLQVAPTSFDVDAKRTFEPVAALQGGPPPEDTVDFWTRAGRNADLTCYGCHATAQVLTADRQDPRGFPLPGSRWIEPGVGCEACHGPGGPHADSARSGTRPPARTLGATGAPADAAARVAACGGCHALQEILRSPFSDVPAHGYGVPSWEWADPLLARSDSAEFREAVFPDLRPATFQQEAAALAQSGCARKGSLTCAGCHDPHSGALRAESAGDGACLPCHAGVKARGEAHTHHAPGTPGSACVACHMAPILRGPASVPAHDHSMAPPVAGENEIPAACVPCHATEKDLLVRGWASFPKDGAASRRRARLAEAFAPGAGNDALAALAADPGEAWTVRVAALDRLSGPRRPQLAPRLRGLLQDGNPAVRRGALRSFPFWAADEDRRTLDRLTLDADPFVALAAVQAYGALGSPDFGARLSDAARRPDLASEYRAQLALGRAALLAEDFPRAETALARALQLRPLQVHALNDLGIALLRQGKSTDAQRAWLQALQINPRFEAAKRNLEASRE